MSLYKIFWGFPDYLFSNGGRFVEQSPVIAEIEDDPSFGHPTMESVLEAIYTASPVIAHRPDPLCPDLYPQPVVLHVVPGHYEMQCPRSPSLFPPRPEFVPDPVFPQHSHFALRSLRDYLTMAEADPATVENENLYCSDVFGRPYALSDSDF